MLFLFVVCLLNPLSNRGKSFQDIIEIAKKHNLYILEANKNFSDVLSVISDERTFLNIFHELQKTNFKIKLGEMNETHYILAQNEINLFSTIFQPSKTFNLSLFRLISLYMLLIFVIVNLLIIYFKKKDIFQIIDETNKPPNFFFFSDNGKVYIGNKDDYIFFNEMDKITKKPMIRKISTNMKTKATSILIVVPFGLDLNIGITTANIIHDIRIDNKFEFAKGEIETDEDEDNREQKQISICTTGETSVRVKIPGKDIIIYPPKEFEPSYLFMRRNTSYVMYEILTGVCQLPPTMEGIHSVLLDMYYKFQFNAIGFFYRISKDVETIDFIADDEKMKSLCLKAISLNKSEMMDSPNITKIDNVNIIVKKLIFGRCSYYLAGALINDTTELEGAKTIFLLLTYFASLVYHSFISELEDSKTLKRISRLLKEDTELTYLEFLEGETKPFTSVGKEPFFDEALTKDLLMNQNLNECCSLFHTEQDKWYNATTTREHDPIIDVEVQCDVFEDLTKFKTNQNLLSSLKSQMDIVSPAYGLFKLINPTTVESTKFSAELGYSKPTTDLNELIYPEDAIILGKIGKQNLIFCRFKAADGRPQWYSIISSYYNNKFCGFIISSQQNMRFNNDEDEEITLLDEENVFFELFLIDTISGKIISALVHKGLKATCIDDIISLAEDSCKKKIRNAWKTMKENPYQKVVFQGKSTTIDDNLHWYNYNFEKSGTNTAMLLMMLIDSTVDSTNKLIEAKTIVDLTFFHSNITAWYFEGNENSEKVMTNKTRGHEFAEWNWSIIEHNVSSNCVMELKEAFNKALETGEPFEVEISMIIDKMRWILIRGQKASLENYLCGVYFDLTELRENELLLEQKKEQALEATKAKSIFLANMSHEIRTPLNGMFSMIELIMETPLTNENKEMMKIVRLSFSRLLDLVNDTLDISKIDQGRMNPSPTIFSPLDVIEQIALEIPNNMNKKDIRVKIEGPPDFPLLCYGDSHLFMRVIHNLFTNAMKFTMKGTVTMRFSWTPELINVAIEDTGIGIPESKLKTIFETFTQVDNSIIRPYEGSGIGLALVSKIISLIKGDIKVESIVGVGSKFTATFPYPGTYFPYFPLSIKKNKNQFIVLRDDLINKLVLDMFEFYGYERIHSIDEINDNLSFIITENTTEMYKEAKKIKKQHPNAQIIVYIVSKEKLKICKDDIVSNFPQKPAVVRNVLVSQKLINTEKENTDIKPPKVLAADDVLANRIALDKILLKIKIPHVIVENGQEVIDKLEKEQFDIVLIDKNMPVMDGPTATRIIRASNKPYSNIPIYAMTASSLDEEKDECLSSGMNKYIMKPITIAKLHKLLTSNL